MRKQLTAILLGIAVLASGAAGCDTLGRVKKSVGLDRDRLTPLPAVTNLTTPKSSALSTLEQTIHAQVNQYRLSRKLSPLKLDSSISVQARAHSQAMASGKVPFSHDGFEQRVSAIAKSISYRSAAENVAYNEGYNDPASKAVEGWLNSPGHLKNIVGDFDLTGVGVVKNDRGEYYFTQIFIRQAKYGIF